MLDLFFFQEERFFCNSKVPFLPRTFVAEILLDLERQAAAAAKIQGDLKEPCHSKKSKTVATPKMKILGFCWLVLASISGLCNIEIPKKNWVRNHYQNNQPQWTDHLATLLWWIPAPKIAMLVLKWHFSLHSHVQKPSAKQFPKHNTATVPKLNGWHLKNDKLSKFGIYYSFGVPIFKKFHVKLWEHITPAESTNHWYFLFFWYLPQLQWLAPVSPTWGGYHPVFCISRLSSPSYLCLTSWNSGNVCQSWRLLGPLKNHETDSKQTPLKIGRHPLKGNEKVFQPYIFRCENVSFREGTSPTWILEGFFAFFVEHFGQIFFCETLNVCWGEKNECVKFAVTMNFTKTKVYESMCVYIYYINVYIYIYTSF